jgi:predicted TIM-barrel fold metal-dependent hydrolase
MDDFGIEAQVLYPNIGVFQVNEYIGMRADPELVLACVRAYNDFLVEWSAIAPGRYVPLMTVPFWDLDETMRELVRAHDAGHKGIVFPARMEDFGLPALHDGHWNRFWGAAQEMGLSINFHIGSGNIPMFGTDTGRHLGYAWTGTMLFNLNASAIASLIFGGICQRFPTLEFVSVESGVGWIPFLLESMDWQFHNSGVVAHHPEFDLLPSEYFARQIGQGGHRAARLHAGAVRDRLPAPDRHHAGPCVVRDDAARAAGRVARRAARGRHPQRHARQRGALVQVVTLGPVSPSAAGSRRGPRRWCPRVSCPVRGRSTSCRRRW